ncbi:serine/threonine-protein kinase [uncultured Methanoregula sp.]|uniref:serine/threonine-protein kinase n=1 Tax=uncultured Methanoregula sp. TaxID=1005933 RepID=UPI002AAB3803|nr:serine/threonine-protein kinase [uncultured Methanoregula sp.]
MDPIDEPLIPNFVDPATENFLKMGFDFIKLGKYHEAIMCFSNAKNSNKKNIDAWLNLGITTSVLKKGEGIQSFKESFNCGFGRTNYIKERFDTLLEFYKKYNKNISHVKDDFEMAKSQIDETKIIPAILTFVKNILPADKPTISRPGRHDPFFPDELALEYPTHKFINEGGTARVYKCKRKKDDLFVAIKLPKEFDRKNSKKFIDEIATWRDLEHKNIVQIFDYSANPAYIVMEFFPQSLSQIDTPMPTNDALKMIIKITDALSYAHKKGIIHNDIKPANILLSKEYEPKLADWGLGRHPGLSTSNFSSDSSYTPLYAAPEQLRSEETDVRTDIWQVGVVLYELVTGQHPFDEGDTRPMGKNILSHEPIDLPSSINPNLKRVDMVLLNCLQKEKSKRYNSVDELSRDIENLLLEDFTTKATTSSVSPYVRLKALFELIRLYTRKNRYDDVLANLAEIQNFSPDEEIRVMLDNEIEAVKFHQAHQISLEERQPEIEKLFKNLLKKHIIETS